MAAPRAPYACDPLRSRGRLVKEPESATRSAFRREHGTPPAFVTADQALQARSRGEIWSAPRCMTAREHARLTQTLNTYAAVR